MEKNKLTKSEIMQRVAENEALIIMGAKQTFEAILNVSMGLKGMKDLGDEVGWKMLGYQDFEDYTVAKWNMAKRQAYKYLQVAERLPENLVHSVHFSSKASLSRLLRLLPNDQNEINLTPEEIEELMILPPDEFKAEVVKLGNYDRAKDGGRGPSDLERPRISRDRYRDQKKKLKIFEEKIDTLVDEKNELVSEIEKQEKLIEEMKNVSSPDLEKAKLIEENKRLVLKVVELEKITKIADNFEINAECNLMDIQVALVDCRRIFVRMMKLELHTFHEWVEFRVMTDLIRGELDAAEEHVAFTMAEKGLQPKEYEFWHEGEFKYQLDRTTEQIRKDYVKKEEDYVDKIMEEAKAERKRIREAQAEDTTKNTNED